MVVGSGGRKDGRRGAMLAAVFLLVGVGGVVATLWLWGEADVGAPAPEESAPAPEKANVPAAKKAPLVRTPRKRVEPPPDPTISLQASWDAALALWKKNGKAAEALAQLAPLRRANPVFFADPARAKLLAELEKAAIAELSRAARSRPLAEVKRLAGLIGDALLDPTLAAQALELVAAAERRALVATEGAGLAIIGHAATPADRERLATHVFRFAGEGTAPAKKDWVDDQLAALDTANAKLKTEPQPLPIPDSAAAEKRRLDQLEKLAQRGAVSLLDHVGGALAWLALHQGEDGHFGQDAAAACCKARKHEPACVPGGNESHQLAATGLTVLAFLDFRDQDVKRLFEPSLSRGIQWLMSQQQLDGSFKMPQGSGYSAAIAMMALGQAAASTGDPRLKASVKSAIEFYALHPGVNGGYRYALDKDQDLSVTGWYVQAMESAVNAGVEVPPAMKTNIDGYLNTVWRGEAKFSYQSGGNPSNSLAPVGMLAMSLLRPDSPRDFGEAWRAFLVKNVPSANVYSLYYSVRILFALDGRVPEEYRKVLDTLAAQQVAKGPSPGMINPLPKDPWFVRPDVGFVVGTAFTTLTFEHSLYTR